MLNLYQRAIDDAMLDGQNVTWVTERQAGKTFIAHHVALRYKSVAYLCPNWGMVDHHIRNYGARGRIAYFPATSPDRYIGVNLSGYDLMIVDDFEHIPMPLLELIPTFYPAHMLMLATRWNEFLTKDLPIPNNNQKLNKFVTNYNFRNFKMFVG